MPQNSTKTTANAGTHNNIAGKWLRSILSRGHGSTRPETNKDTSGGPSSQAAVDTTATKPTAAMRETTPPAVSTSTSARGSNEQTATTAVYVSPSAKTTYPPFLVDKYASNPGSRKFTFFNGAVISAAPRIDAPMVSEETLRADEKMIEWMSKGRDATAPSYVDGKKLPPVVEVIYFPDKATGEQIIDICKQIRAVIASGRAVALVPSSQDPLYKWDPKTLAHLIANTSDISTCKIVLHWQCTRKRDIEHEVHRAPDSTVTEVDLCDSGTAEEFVNAVKQNLEPLNCLDAPQVAGPAPDIISKLSDDCSAWNMTHNMGYQKPHKVHSAGAAQKESKKDVAGTSNSKAKAGGIKRKREDHKEDEDRTIEQLDQRDKRRRTARERDHEDRRKSKHDITSVAPKEDTTPVVGSGQKFPTQKFDFKFTGTRGTGPSYIESDVDKMRRWMLLSGASFYTWPHHDAAGLLTWSMLLTGMKMWSYVVPNDPETDAELAARQYVELVEAMDHISVDTENRLPDIATAHNLFLAPNTILIQAPGMPHHVLTLENSITQGGHMLMRDAMHLTEWTRILSHVCQRAGTNDLHPGVQRTLGRMMIATAQLGPQEVPKKPFMALARLVLFAKNYWKGDYDSDQVHIPAALKPPKKHASDAAKEAWNEHEEACRIARAILSYNDIVDPKPLELLKSEEGVPIGWRTRDGGNNSDDGSTDWRDVGSETLYIPEFPRM